MPFLSSLASLPVKHVRTAHSPASPLLYIFLSLPLSRPVSARAVAFRVLGRCAPSTCRTGPLSSRSVFVRLDLKRTSGPGIYMYMYVYTCLAIETEDGWDREGARKGSRRRDGHGGPLS